MEQAAGSPTESSNVYKVGGDWERDIIFDGIVEGGKASSPDVLQNPQDVEAIYTSGEKLSDEALLDQELKALFLNYFGGSDNQAMLNMTRNYSEENMDPSVWAFQVPKQSLSPEAIIAIVLGILGLIANASSLVAICRIRNSLSANLRLIVSLCSSDMLVSVCILLRLLYKSNASEFSHVGQVCCEHFLRALRMTSHIVSLLNLVGLALDHYFAIIKPLKYPSLMCKKRANIMIVSFWIISGMFGFSDFVIPSSYFSYCNSSEPLHFCDKVDCTVFNEEYIMFVVAFISSVLMTVLYTTIFVKIQRYQAFQQNFRQNMKRNRRGLITTFVILVTFMLTWLPYCLFDVIVIIANRINPKDYVRYFKASQALEWHFYNLLLLNSLLDPIIYAIRMREVQNGYRNICPWACKKGNGRLSLSLSDKRSQNLTTTVSVYTRQSQNESHL